jgi:hypothetical protein
MQQQAAGPAVGDQSTVHAACSCWVTCSEKMHQYSTLQQHLEQRNQSMKECCNTLGRKLFMCIVEPIRRQWGRDHEITPRLVMLKWDPAVIL